MTLLFSFTSSCQVLAPTVSKMVSEVTVLRSRYQELLQRREALRNETSKAQDDMEEDGEVRSISPIKTRSVQKQESENYFRQNSQVVLKAQTPKFSQFDP